ncbi:MAG: nitronate monooxygenase [Armatimonadetes bacterium]|nr:nitronate monooxygenase [Armatimonadota bacterium]
MTYPSIIQGGMGTGVSSWVLASAVAKRGQIGVVSGTGLDVVFARRLQLGDVGGHLRRAAQAFPIKEVADRVWSRYYIEGGKRASTPFKSKPMPSIKANQALTELTVLANFVEVFLAKEGHKGLIGINLLEKIQLPTLPSIFGAMLAGVDFVLMGAGIPRAIPMVLDKFASLDPVELPLDVNGALPGEQFTTHFAPVEFCPSSIRSLERPEFFAIVASSALATTLKRKATGAVNGFVVEGNTAGGHNAPPRGAMLTDASGQPIYGPRDDPELDKFCELGLPFWLAGSYGSRERLQEAIAAGAQGIQVGTPFAFCEESGIDPEIKSQVIQMSREGKARVFTDPLASPTGFPFKVLDLGGTLSDSTVYRRRDRLCDLGYLRELYRKEDGTIGYRCPGEPVTDYVAKGGDEANTSGRKCLCNGLLATIGLAQTRKTGSEPPIVTAGDDVANLTRFLKAGQATYSANDVIDTLLAV